jgi:hypothetical protein
MAVSHRKLGPARIASAVLPLVTWWLGLAAWLAVGGGFNAIQDTPHSGMPIMAGGTIAVVVLCILIGGRERWRPYRSALRVLQPVRPDGLQANLGGWRGSRPPPVRFPAPELPCPRQPVAPRPVPLLRGRAPERLRGTRVRSFPVRWATLFSAAIAYVRYVAFAALGLYTFIYIHFSTLLHHAALADLKQAH